MRIADPVQQAERREQILDAALKAFATNGFHRTSMTEIAAVARMSAGNLYRYFPSKDDIIAALADRERRDTNRFFETLAAAPDLVDGLILALSVASDAQSRSKYVVDLEIAAELARNPSFVEPYVKLEDEAIAGLAHALASAQAKGQVEPSLDPDAAARMLIAISYALPSMTLRGQTARHKAVEDEMARLIENYLRPRTSAR